MVEGFNPTTPLVIKQKICLFYPSQDMRKAMTNIIKGTSLGFESEFMVCQKHRREDCVACIKEYLIMLHCAINFNKRKVGCE